jgi:hypothetical protein
MYAVGMTVSELIEMLRQCEPSATCALVDSVGIYELTGVQQTPDRYAVFLTHVCTGFEAALGDDCLNVAGAVDELSDNEVHELMDELRGLLPDMARGGTR